jgi:hypothetical protein
MLVGEGCYQLVAMDPRREVFLRVVAEKGLRS